jgi:iron-sulfur cluster assembly protein
MITLTPSAAEQIRESARKSNMQGVPLRIAATRLEDGNLHYALGFDDTGRVGDSTFKSEGIELVVAPESLEMLDGTVIDYVALEDSKEIIFINPNDPAQQQKD